MTWIDYKHIKASVKLAEVLARYDIRLRKSDNQHLCGPCPLPGHSGDRSNKNAFHVDTEKNVFNCFTHCKGGNVIDFVAKMERCEFRDAALKLHQWFLADQSNPDHTTDTNAELTEQRGSGLDSSANQPLTFQLKGLQNNHPFLSKVKGMTTDTIRQFGVGFCTKGLLAGRIAIPITNRNGQIVAYAGRAVNDTQAELEGKYKLPPGFKKTLEVFNLHRVVIDRERIQRFGLIVVEGFFGVMHLHQLGFTNVVALMGKELSDVQAELLLDTSKQLTVFLDGDEPGREGAERVGKRLISDSHVRLIRYPEGTKRKPAQFSKEELIKLLS